VAHAALPATEYLMSVRRLMPARLVLGFVIVVLPEG
jgi:hypothetical protein